MKGITKEIRRINQPKPVYLKCDYDDYWTNKKEIGGLTQERQDILSKIESCSTVMDVGCGNGRALQYLKHAKAKGIDFSKAAVEKARANGFDAEVADIMEYKYRAYDYIVVFDVLEHIQNPELLLNNLKGKFRKSLIISVPNICFWSFRLRMLLGYSPTQVPIADYSHWGHHIRFWSLKDLEYWLKELGYKIKEIYPQGTNDFLKKTFPNLFATDFLMVLK